MRHRQHALRAARLRLRHQRHYNFQLTSDHLEPLQPLRRDAGARAAGDVHLLHQRQHLRNRGRPGSVLCHRGRGAARGAADDTYYYRYYTSSGTAGFQHALKYVFRPLAYQAMMAANGNPSDPDGLAESAVAPTPASAWPTPTRPIPWRSRRRRSLAEPDLQLHLQRRRRQRAEPKWQTQTTEQRARPAAPPPCGRTPSRPIRSDKSY